MSSVEETVLATARYKLNLCEYDPGNQKSGSSQWKAFLEGILEEEGNVMMSSLTTWLPAMRKTLMEMGLVTLHDGLGMMS